MRDGNGVGTGIAYVTFVNKEDVEKGIDFNGGKMKGRIIRTTAYHKNHDKMEEKKKQLIEKKKALKKEKKRKAEDDGEEKKKKKSKK